MAIYTGSIYNNNNSFYASNISSNFLNKYGSISVSKYNNDNITVVSGSITTYYQRVFSSGLNDWSYYKTTGSINSNPLPSQTVPSYSGSILIHEVIGKLQT